MFSQLLHEDKCFAQTQPKPPAQLATALICQCAATVLAVDDQPHSLIALAATLDRYNIKYDLSTSGIDVVEMFKNNWRKSCCDLRYKLVITDMNMPDQSGLDVIRQIREFCQQQSVQAQPQPERRMPEGRQNTKNCCPPIVAYSAYEEISTLQYQEAGLAGFLPKPFT